MNLDKQFKDALADRFEGWEIVELLNIPVETIIDMLENEIYDNLDEVKEAAGFYEDDNEGQ